jgi:hypothetical protein
MTDVPVDFTADAPTAGPLDVRWIHGAPASRPADDPPIQVHRYDPHTVILRQSKSVSYEAPFLYLLFGNDRALLLDTGATGDPASLDRMVALAESRAVTHVLGCHIEMTTRPGRDYPLGALYQPDEPALEMTVAQLRDVRAAAAAVAGQPGVHPFDHFIIDNDPTATTT